MNSKKTFTEEMVNLNASIEKRDNLENEIIEAHEKEAKLEEKKEEETIFEVIEKEGGPDRAQIEEWKQRYNDKLFAVYFDKNDFYIYRYITLPEWKDVLQQFGNSKVKNDILLDELIVGKGLLFPAFSVELRATVGGGTLETLAKQIRLSSNFLPDDVAIRMIQKL